MMAMAETSVSFHVKSEDFRVSLGVVGGGRGRAGWERLVPLRPHRA